MTNIKSTQRALLASVMALFLCFTMLLGTTFAWFTDSVTSANNIIKAGNLDIELYHTDKAITDEKVNNQTTLFDDVDLWEPGVMVWEELTVKNEGDLALKYQLTLNVHNATVVEGVSFASILKVALIDEDFVYNRENVEAIDAGEWKELATFTLADELNKQESEVYGIVIWWQPSNNDNLFNMNNGKTDDVNVEIGVKLVATQLAAEEDSFGNDYDADAPVDFTPVSTAAELKVALANNESNIVLTSDIEVSETLNITTDTVLSGRAIRRGEGFTGTVINVASGVSLTLKDIVVDGGAVWASAVAEDSSVNGGVVATGNLIAAESNAEIILNEGAVLQNNDGAHAVNLGTRIGATLTINGGEIINNRSDSGAVWGGGHITLNAGKISNNVSTGSAGAIRMVSNCNLTMNGGEISNNTAVGSGGAIWGYGASTYEFNGGEMNGNTAAVGGAIYTGDSSTIKISGDFEMCNNTADDAGAMRLSNRTAFNMSGGKISGNTSTNSPAWNGFYGWNPGVNITGGELADDITIQGGLTPIVGGSGITGVVHFALSTNHNTANLASDFGTFKFTVAEGSNFAAFNLKPATGYVYTEGDEAKLICMNEGYETYWDATTSTFKLQAK